LPSGGNSLSRLPHPSVPVCNSTTM
jgi:hypothetical protein